VEEALDLLAPGKELIGDFTIDHVKAQWRPVNPSAGEGEPGPFFSGQDKYESFIRIWISQQI
jgi:hypothetical protein